MVVPTFPGILLAITLFVMAVRVGLYDTHYPLILANTLINLPFTIWNLRTVFAAVSREIEESAMVEGCSRFQALVRVVLPITVPGLAATYAFVYILSWNEYLFATTFISTSEKRLITTTMASAIGQFNVDYGKLIPAAILSTLPLIILFMFIQRYIIKGLAWGVPRDKYYANGKYQYGIRVLLQSSQNYRRGKICKRYTLTGLPLRTCGEKPPCPCEDSEYKCRCR